MRYVLAATDTAQKLHSIRCQRTGDFAQTDDQIKQRIHALSDGLIEVVKVPEGGGNETVQVIHQSPFVCVMPNTEPPGNDNIHNSPAPFDGSYLNHLVTEVPDESNFRLGIPGKQLCSHSIDNSVMS
ncbi:hypothetical protein AFLA70_466g000770 [Aspergillus flavus AF70]|nr:hypothetical protein AFLA70_466g000770 [Aspergillus flavus AF70]